MVSFAGLRSAHFFRLSMLCLLGLSLSVGAVAEGLRYKVEGVDEELRANIRAYLGDSPSDTATAELFLLSAQARAEQALQALGFYRSEISLSLDRQTDPWRARVLVKPGEPLRYTEISVSLLGEATDDLKLQDVVAERAPVVGDTVHHGRYEAFKNELQQLARQRGYFDASFALSSVDIDLGANTAKLLLSLQGGSRYRVGDVSVEPGLIDPGLLNRLLPFVADDFYEQRLILELRQRLVRLGYFSSVVVLPDVALRDAGRVPLRVDLTPAPGHSFELGVGFSTDTGQRLSLSWRSPRLNRWGHSQETIVRVSPVNPAARVTYSIPLDDSANDILQLSARLEDNEFGDLDSVQRELGVRREFTRPDRVSSVQLRALNETWGVFSDDFEADFLLASVSRSYRRRQGNAVDPQRGLSQFYSADAGSSALGSDEDLLRLYGSITGVRRLNSSWRVLARAEVGMLWTSSERPDDLPPSLAFFAGGDNSIRGYGYQSLGREVSPLRLTDESQRNALVVGGTRLLTGSFELQRYFGKDWRGAVFVDAGDAFVGSDFEANVGVGFGIHYLSPVGALRLELANPVTRSGGSWRVHINIGAEF